MELLYGQNGVGYFYPPLSDQESIFTHPRHTKRVFLPAPVTPREYFYFIYFIFFLQFLAKSANSELISRKSFFRFFFSRVGGKGSLIWVGRGAMAV